MLKFSGAVIWRLGTRANLRKCPSSSAAALKNDKNESRSSSDKLTSASPEAIKENAGNNKGLLAAAFASINAPEDDDTKEPSPKSVKHSKQHMLDNQIQKANDVDSLLVVAENSIVSRRHALKMVSVLSDWSNSNKVKISDFEKDPRFLKLCRILARTTTTHAMSSMTMAEDLGTVLGITGDDEAARLITNLTLPQMIKVMKALQQKGRRSTPLLRALSHNITRQEEVIDLKKSADLLFSMATLNFPDPILLDRICNDVIECLPSNSEKPSVVTSIVVSLGLLKYRHEAALAAIAEWMHSRRDVCRANDVASAVVTFATLHYVPPQSEELFEIAVSLKEDEMSRSTSWLDLVFALVILEKAQKGHLASTLRPEFIDKLLTAGEISIQSRRKLMMIDAYAHMKYKSKVPRLPEDVSVGVPLVYTKEKMVFVHAILDTFKSLVSAESFLKKDCNSGMGFLYDAEFAVDAKCHPVPLEKAINDKSKYRIAVMGLDYHDMTRKVAVPLGVNHLCTVLLQLQGFKVLQIPYTEFNPKDKLVTRVQYINRRLKELLDENNAA
ncbi:unnamed protein product [Chilo suppressalis]|uniref:RAP domain-containing protein n=1 Tax=Chilo suppressalis TaxID=168631 RepID=A0ABN8L4I9_CHISP|nr:unnamed protein product [Chilo suppressalis]